ncbi:diaminopimelate epimerase [bacterium]|nr:diaminopimelate epimerase [bacterium]
MQTKSVKKNLSFVKMQAGGNDFVVLDGRHGLPLAEEKLTVQILDRHFGVGGDGLLILKNPKTADYAVTYRNADGSETICGNGFRCISRYIYDLYPGVKEFELEVFTGKIAVKIIGSGERVRTDIGHPSFQGIDIPTARPGEFIDHKLPVDTDQVQITALSVGNPHCVIEVAKVDLAPVTTLGPQLECHPFFPERTNVEFVELCSDSRAKIRIWERGVGETLSCGTGASAVAIALMQKGKISNPATIETRGGVLEVFYDKEQNLVKLTGPADYVFRGEIQL